MEEMRVRWGKYVRTLRNCPYKGGWIIVKQELADREN